MFQLLIVAIVIICASGQDPPESVSPSQTCEGPNEIYLAEGVAPNCDTVCSEIGEPCTKVYVKAPSGCYCLPNHARDADNVCVPISECQISCKSLESRSDDGSFSLRIKETSRTHRPGLPLPTLPLPHLKLPHLPTPSSSLPASLSSLSKLAPWLSHPRLPLPLPHPSSSQQPSLSSVSSISSMSAISSISSPKSTRSLPLLPHQSSFLESHLLRPRGVCSYPSFLSPNAVFSPHY